MTVLSTVKINIFFGRYLATEQGSLPFLVNPPKCMYFIPVLVILMGGQREITVINTKKRINSSSITDTGTKYIHKRG